MQVGLKLIALVTGAALAASLLCARQSSLVSPQDGFLLEAGFQPQGSYLGVRLADIDADRAATLKLSEARGVEIVAVQSGSPAAKAGFRAGDVILTYNGENVLGAQQLGRLVGETPPGRRIKIQYWRDGKMGQTVVVTAAIESFPNVFNALPPDVWRSAKVEAQLLGLQGSPLEIPAPIMIWKNSLLGFWCEPIDDQLADYFGVKRGVLVRAVDKDSPADKAGVKAGDIVTGIGEHHVNGPHDVTSYLRAQNQPLRSVTIEVTRNRKPMTFHITIDSQ